MKTVAAILVETGKPLELGELEIPALKPGQVIVEIVFSGVCHTQLLESRGHRGPDRFLPHCLGHEGSGVVVETGPGVTKVKTGDKVVLSWIKGSGAEAGGTVYGWAGRKVNAGPVTTFSRHSVVSENRLTPVPAGLDMRHAALVGCAMATGMGAVFNTAKPSPGESAVVFGTGGVGLCAVAGAALSGCHPIIAVDMVPEKLELAKKLGATHAVSAAEGDVVEKILAICPGGVDLAVEASGRPPAMEKSVKSLRPQGGRTVIIGNSRHGEKLEIEPFQLNLGKRILGTWGGESVPDRDFPRFGRILGAGRFDPSLLQSSAYPLGAINRALEDLEGGRSIRPLIDMAKE